jgi:hypothetical protein
MLGPSDGGVGSWAMASPQNTIANAKIAMVAFISFVSFSAA